MTVSGSNSSFSQSNLHESYQKGYIGMFPDFHQWGQPGNKAKIRMLAQFGHSIANRGKKKTDYVRLLAVMLLLAT